MTSSKWASEPKKIGSWKWRQWSLLKLSLSLTWLQYTLTPQKSTPTWRVSNLLMITLAMQLKLTSWLVMTMPIMSKLEEESSGVSMSPARWRRSLGGYYPEIFPKNQHKLSPQTSRRWPSWKTCSKNSGRSKKYQIQIRGWKPPWTKKFMRNSKRPSLTMHQRSSTWLKYHTKMTWKTCRTILHQQKLFITNKWKCWKKIQRRWKLSRKFSMDNWIKAFWNLSRKMRSQLGKFIIFHGIS